MRGLTNISDIPFEKIELAAAEALAVSGLRVIAKPYPLPAKGSMRGYSPDPSWCSIWSREPADTDLSDWWRAYERAIQRIHP